MRSTGWLRPPRERSSKSTRDGHHDPQRCALHFWQIDAPSRAQSKLTSVAEALKDQDDRKIVVEGHTDSVGSDASNQELSMARAQSVVGFLTSHGVPADRVTAQGFGASRPVADNKSPEGRANNRRVEIIVQNQEAR